MCKRLEIYTLNPPKLADVSITFKSSRGKPFWVDETPNGQRTDYTTPVVLLFVSLS